jgi:2-dehydropantoate 2-reductase
VQPSIATSIEEAIRTGPYDVGLFALKSFDTQEMVDSLRPYKDYIPTILCLQNGVDNESIISSSLGEDKVIAASITTSVGKSGLGVITVEKLRGIGIASGNQLSDEITRSFNICNLNATLVSSANSMKWSKLLTNLLANSSSAILDMTPAQIFAHPGLYSIEVSQILETLAVMDKLGLKVIDLPGTPVTKLIFLIKNLPQSLSRPILSKIMGAGRGAKMPSFHIDLYSQRGKTEVGYLNGAVVRHGNLFGLHSPINEGLNSILQDLTDGKIPLDLYRKNPEKFISALKEGF